MKAYLDSSVMLRWLFGEKNALKMPPGFEVAISNEILRIETFRTIDRLRLDQGLDEAEVSIRSEALHTALKRVKLLRMNREIVERACLSFPTRLRSLDAIHLATAMEFKKIEGELTFLTHDLELARAAKATGFPVLGV